jgi:hypothetical protein
LSRSDVPPWTVGRFSGRVWLPFRALLSADLLTNGSLAMRVAAAAAVCAGSYTEVNIRSSGKTVTRDVRYRVRPTGVIVMHTLNWRAFPAFRVRRHGGLCPDLRVIAMFASSRPQKDSYRNAARHQDAGNGHLMLLSFGV